MAFPDGFLDEVRRSADIVRVVEGRVALKKFGASYKGLCPFHNEKTPSFNVRAEPPLFHCFGCGEGGDVFKFVMLSEQMSFPEAVETLARRFGVPLPERSGQESAENQRREQLFAALEAAALHYQDALWTNAGTAAREYLLGRGFERETLEKIRAGAARDSWDDLLVTLRRKFGIDVLLEAGLVLARQDGSGHYDRFRGRAVFPILDESGRVCGFGARSLDGSEPKYLNSPESPVYQKSKVLYGLSWAKSAIRREGRAVLMEGYLDVARAIEHGVGEAVATCGTALTPQHARALRRHTEKVAVNFDQDAAGQKAAEKSLEILAGEALKVQVVELPEGDDPDTFLKAKGGDAYRERLAAAPVHMEWLIRRAGAGHDLTTPAGKAEYLNALLPALSRIASEVERAAWVPRIAEVGHLDERATAHELRKALSHNARVAVPPPPRPEPVPRAAEPQAFEKLLLGRILGGDEDLAFLEELHEDELEGLATAELLLAAKELWMRGAEVSATALQDAVASESGRRLLAAVAMADSPKEGASAEDCVKKLRKRRVQARMDEIQRAVRAAQGAELDALLQEKTDLSRQLAQI